MSKQIPNFGDQPSFRSGVAGFSAPGVDGVDLSSNARVVASSRICKCFPSSLAKYVTSEGR